MQNYYTGVFKQLLAEKSELEGFAGFEIIMHCHPTVKAGMKIFACLHHPVCILIRSLFAAAALNQHLHLASLLISSTNDNIVLTNLTGL